MDGDGKKDALALEAARIKKAVFDDDEADEANQERIGKQWDLMKRVAANPVSASISDLLGVEKAILEILIGRLTWDRSIAAADRLIGHAYGRLDQISQEG